MNDSILLNQLVDDLSKRGYIIKNPMNILKINYKDEDIKLLIECHNNFQDINNKKFIIRCFTQKNYILYIVFCLMNSYLLKTMITDG